MPSARLMIEHVPIAHARTPGGAPLLTAALAPITRSSAITSLLAGALALALAGCAPLGVASDGSSVSGGHPNRGWLLDGRRIADEGEGFVSPPQWRHRGLRYATDEMISLLTGAAREVAAVNAPVRLAVADMSFDGGGPAYTHHRSHQNGRDADLLLYMLDEAGRPYQSAAMIPVDDDGLATDDSRHRLDVPRTWQLVRALVTSPEHNVQYLFLNETLIQLLLDHARSVDEPPWLIDLARQTLIEPSGAPHPDHLHVRIYCAPTDVDIGCRELGSLALLDKHFEGVALESNVHVQLLRRLPIAGSGLLAWRLVIPIASPAASSLAAMPAISATGAGAAGAGAAGAGAAGAGAAAGGQ